MFKSNIELRFYLANNFSPKGKKPVLNHKRSASFTIWIWKSIFYPFLSGLQT